MAGPLPAVEVSEPSPAAKVPGPSTIAEAAETSSARGAITVEEVMELVTCRYIDFPGVRVIDLEAPQLPEKVLEVVTERMFAESLLMETIASVSKALHEYERAGGFAPHAASGASEAIPEAPAAGMEHAADASVPPPTSESREAPLPEPVEATEIAAAVLATSVAEVVAGEAGSSSSRPVAAEVDRVPVPDQLAAAIQKRVPPEGTTSAVSPVIQ
jgi:hypothetical protein